MVEGDVYNICERIREIDPRLFIVQLESEDRCAYAIMEHCEDGVDRLVYKAFELDQRILAKMEYIRKVPFEQRFAAIEAEIEKEEAEQKERESEELFQKLGLPMQHQFAHDGFTDPWGASYAKRSTLSGRL